MNLYAIRAIYRFDPSVEHFRQVPGPHAAKVTAGGRNHAAILTSTGEILMWRGSPIDRFLASIRDAAVQVVPIDG